MGQEICNVRLMIHADVSDLKRSMMEKLREDQFMDIALPHMGRLSRRFGREIVSISFGISEELTRR